MMDSGLERYEFIDMDCLCMHTVDCALYAHIADIDLDMPAHAQGWAPDTGAFHVPALCVGVDHGGVNLTVGFRAVLHFWTFLR